MQLADALKFIEDKIPGSINHEVEAAQKVVAAHYAEFTSVTAKLKSLLVVADSTAVQLDDIKRRIDEAEAEVDALVNPPPAVQPPASPPVQEHAK